MGRPDPQMVEVWVGFYELAPCWLDWADADSCWLDWADAARRGPCAEVLSPVGG